MILIISRTSTYIVKQYLPGIVFLELWKDGTKYVQQIYYCKIKYNIVMTIHLTKYIKEYQIYKKKITKYISHNYIVSVLYMYHIKIVMQYNLWTIKIISHSYWQKTNLGQVHVPILATAMRPYMYHANGKNTLSQYPTWSHL